MKFQTAALALLLGVSLVACPTSAPPPTLTNYAAIVATVDKPIAMTKTTTTDGIAPITYQADPANPLPTGITVNPANGDISGTPKTAAAQKTYAVIARDGGGREARASVSITVNGAFTAPAPFAGITTTIGVPVNVSLPTITGGTLPRRISVSPVLPAGLTLSFDDSTGIASISGTLSSAVPSTAYTVTLTDANGATVTQTFNITVNGGLTPPAPFAGIRASVGEPINVALPVFTGGTSPRQVVIAPQLPAGLTLTFVDNTGIAVISGTLNSALPPTTYTVTLTDASGATITQTFSLSLRPVLTFSYPVSTVITALGVPISSGTGAPIHNATNVSSGGAVAYSVTPSLPNGVTLNPATGLLSGTPTQVQTATTYTVSATNPADADYAASSTTTQFSLEVTASPIIAYPGGTLEFTQGSAIAPITASLSGGVGPYTVSDVSANSLSSQNLALQASGNITGGLNAVQGTQTYTIRVTDSLGATSTANVTIRINPPVTFSGAYVNLTTTRGQASASVSPNAVTGGTAPITYSVSPTAPTWLMVGSTGISAQPDAAAALGTVNYTVTATDINGSNASSQISVTVNAAPTLTLTPANGIVVMTVGQTSSASVTSSGSTGTAPYVYSLFNADLVSGFGDLSINASSGAVTIPASLAVAGNNNKKFKVVLTDARGVSTEQAVTLVTNSGPTLVLSQSAVTMTDTQTSSASLTATGVNGTPAYTYSLVNLDLVSGFGNLSIAGGLVTIPASLAVIANNGKSFKVVMTDAQNVIVEQTVTLTVNPAPSLTVSSVFPMTAGQLGGRSVISTGVGGTGALTYSLAIGNLSTGLTGISIDSSTGAVTIANSVAVIGNASKSFKVVATDTLGVKAEQTVTLTVNAGPSFTISSSSIVTTAGQTQGIPAINVITNSGGTANFTYSLTLPAGLTGITIDSSTGAVTIPSSVAVTANNGKVFSVVLTDANNVAVSRTVTLTVNATPSLTLSSNSIVTTAGQTLSIPNVAVASTSGGTAPYIYSLTLPAGLTGITINSSTGAVSIANSVAATTANNGKTFNIVLTDAKGVPATQTVTLTVNAAPTLTISSNSAIMTAGQTAGVSLTSSGLSGTGTYSYTLVNINVATNFLSITINAATGAVTIPGGLAAVANNNTSFKVRLTDARGVFAEQTLTLTVNAAPTLTLSSNAVGLTLTQTLSVTLTSTGASGTGPYGYSLTNGNLSTGLTGISIDPSTGALIITSSVAVTGNNGKTFNVVLIDAKGVTATQTVTLTVNAAPSFTISSNAVTMIAGQTSSVTVTVTAASGGTLAYVYSLVNESFVAADFNTISINSSTGAVTIPAGVTTANNGKAFKVRLSDARGVPVDQTVTLTVTNSNLSLSSSTYETTKTAASQLALTYTTTGTGPFTVTQNGGSATGLTLTISAGNISIAASAGAMSGTVILEARNASNVLTGTAVLTVTVNAVPTINAYVNTAINGLDSFFYTPINPGTGSTATPWSVICTGSSPLAGALQSTPVVDAETGEILGGPLVPGYDIGQTASCSVRYTDARGVQSAPDTWTITIVP